jgi:hypothetical protein
MHGCSRDGDAKNSHLQKLPTDAEQIRCLACRAAAYREGEI